MNMMKRILSLLLCLMLLLGCSAVAETADAPLTDEEEKQWAEWTIVDEASDTSNADNAEALTADEDSMLSSLESSLNETTPLDEVDLTNLDVNGDLPDNVFNILLLGVDNRSTELQRGLSDANIICSINKDTGSVKLSSIARDTAVSVPGYKTMNRINTAYKRGGPELAMKTINRTFQMNVERYVVINIHGLADMIDALGGVDMDMTHLEASRINFELRKEPMDNVKREKVPAVDGVQHLDGMQAVTFARIRGLDSDLERTRRQRQLLETLLEKVMVDMDAGKFLSLVETALQYGQTNLTSEEMLSLGMTVLSGEAMQNLKNGGEVLTQFRIPIDKKYGYKGFNGVALLYMNAKNLKYTIESLDEFIYGQSYYKE